MDFEFGNTDLEDVYYNPKASLRHGPLVDKGFRKVIGKIIAAVDESDLRAMKSLHYQRLEGNRQDQYALDITEQRKLIVKRVPKSGGICLLIISVEDSHEILWR